MTAQEELDELSDKLSKNHTRLNSALKPLLGCGICGGKLVQIRGKYPGDEKREVCPTCLQERMDQINEISNKEYGVACKAT